MNQNMVNELLMTITHGRALTKLDLIGVKHINSTENYQKLCESIVCLNELKYLNLSDNSFNPQQVGELVSIISEAENINLRSLDLSHNNMSPKQEHQFKNKKDKVGFMGDAEETLHFYDSVGAILKKNILQHLNLEWMRLGNRAVLLCQALVGNTSLSTVHLSNNLIDAPALATIKWNLSIGIEHGL